jgi:uncharacterized RDD family membrane protein YckC
MENQDALSNEHYAGFWVRFVAACIDMALYAPFYFGIKYALGPNHEWLSEGVFGVGALLTYAWFFSSKWQGSPGMFLLKFHICGTEREKIGFWRALLWGVVGTVGWIICCAGILYLQKDITIVHDMLESCITNNVEMTDCIPEIEALIRIPYTSFEQLMFAATGLTIFLFFIWGLSIALPKDKTGFHNLICRTRFVKGRA